MCRLPFVEIYTAIPSPRLPLKGERVKNSPYLSIVRFYAKYPCDTGNYAFLMESTMNEYIRQMDCELMQIGGLLDAKGKNLHREESS